MKITKVVVHVERETGDDSEDSSKIITIERDKIALETQTGIPAVQRPRDVKLAHSIMELVANYNGEGSPRPRRMFRS